MSGITVPTIDEIKGPTVMTKLRNLVTSFITFADEVNDKIDEPLEQALTAVATANSASATANAASSAAHVASENANNASAVATQAATTVATYDDRLEDAEDGVAENKANILTHDGEISTLNNEVQILYDRDANNVKLDVNHVQTVEGGLILNGINKTSDTSVGELNDKIVNAKRLIEEINTKLNAYPYMVRTSDEQNIYGEKSFYNNIIPMSFIINKTGEPRTPTENKVFQIEVDSNEGYTHYIAFNNSADGSRSINIVMYVSETDVAYFNLTYTAEGEKKIFTNFPKPEGW